MVENPPNSGHSASENDAERVSGLQGDPVGSRAQEARESLEQSVENLSASIDLALAIHEMDRREITELRNALGYIAATGGFEPDVTAGRPPEQAAMDDALAPVTRAALAKVIRIARYATERPNR